MNGFIKMTAVGDELNTEVKLKGVSMSDKAQLLDSFCRALNIEFDHVMPVLALAKLAFETTEEAE